MLAVIDTYTIMRYEIRDRTIKPEEAVDFLNKDGKRIQGRVYMRGRNVYMITKDTVYWKDVQDLV